MTHIGCYDDTAQKIEEICERLGWTECEVIETLLDEALADPDSTFYEGD